MVPDAVIRVFILQFDSFPGKAEEAIPHAALAAEKKPAV